MSETRIIGKALPRQRGLSLRHRTRPLSRRRRGAGCLARRISSARRTPMRGSARSISKPRARPKASSPSSAGANLRNGRRRCAWRRRSRACARSNFRRCRSTRSASSAIPCCASSRATATSRRTPPSSSNIDYDELDAVADLRRRRSRRARRWSTTPAGQSGLAPELSPPAIPAAASPKPRSWSKPRSHQQRQTHAPIETRGCCAVWDAGRRHLTMHIGNQVPHPFRTQLAARHAAQ